MDSSSRRTSILDFFTGEPRPEQRRILLEIERCYASCDVLLLRMPVGAGKSRVAHCIASWAGHATLCTPTNQLLAQYTETWPDLPTLARGSSRTSAAARAVVDSPIKAANFYTYLAHRLYSPLVIFDEAHKLVEMLREMEAITLWQHLDPVPNWVQDAAGLLAWAETTDHTALARKLRQHPDSYTLEAGVGEYRGNLRSYVRLVPLTPRYNRPFLWPHRTVRKLILMSATIHYEDLYDLGLEGRRVKLLDCGSPIAAEDRPVVYLPTANMSVGQRDRAVPALVERLRALLDLHANERGVIHTTYELASELKRHLGGHPRLRWHDAQSRERVYRTWRGEAGAPVLVACGMAEGIDLPGDLCRWQAVTKLMFPDLGDPAVAAKRALRPEWYAWCAARDLQQAVGRSSRGPGDWSTTYVLDSGFAGLYARHSEMFTPSFQAALHTMTT